MPREARVDIAGFHYVANRSEAGKKVFKQDKDKAEFLSILCRSCARYEAKIDAFFISDSAYHLIIQTTKANLSLLMRQVSSAYALYFNKKSKNSGSIWRDRFFSRVINGKSEMLLVHKYIALLPKIEKLKKDPLEYRYSYLTTIFSDSLQLDCLEKHIKTKKLEGFLSGNFEQTDMDAFRQFKRMANRGIIKEKNAEEQEPLEKIFKKIKSKEKRDKKIKKAFLSGYTQNEIARYLELSQSSISKIVNREGNA